MMLNLELSIRKWGPMKNLGEYVDNYDNIRVFV